MRIICLIVHKNAHACCVCQMRPIANAIIQKSQRKNAGSHNFVCYGLCQTQIFWREWLEMPNNTIKKNEKARARLIQVFERKPERMTHIDVYLHCNLPIEPRPT